MNKMIVAGVALLAASGMSGCASTDKVLAQPVTETFHTTQSPTEVAFCLGNKNNVPALDRADGSKVVLLKNGYGGVSLAFSIYPEETGSRVEYRKKFGTVGGIWKRCVGAKPQNT